MAISNGFYQAVFPPGRICKVMEEPHGRERGCPKPGWPFELTFTYRGRPCRVTTTTGRDGCFCLEDVPLGDGSGCTLGDLIARGCPDFPWEGNAFPITIREAPMPGSSLAGIQTGGACPGQSPFAVRGDTLIYRYRRAFPTARAVFSRNFFGLKGCGNEYRPAPETHRFLPGQATAFSVEGRYETGPDGRGCLVLTARAGSCSVQTRLSADEAPFDTLGFLFSLPPRASITLTELTLNGAPLPDIGSCQAGHRVAVLPGECVQPGSDFTLCGRACIKGPADGPDPGEALSFSVELLASPWACFVNRPCAAPAPGPCKPDCCRPPYPPPCPAPTPLYPDDSCTDRRCPPPEPPCPPPDCGFCHNMDDCNPPKPPCPPPPCSPPCPPSGSDSCPPKPPCPPGPIPAPPGTLQVRAYKQVKGGTLRAGQFDFVLERPGGRVVGKGSNDGAGWVHFGFLRGVCIEPQGEWLTLREVTGGCQAQGEWKMDTTCYQVFVRPCDNTVVYHGPQGFLPGVPTFTNVRRGGPSISGMKRTPTGRPIPGWRILLHRERDGEHAPPFRTQVTDCRGRYRFDNIPRGRYRITEAPREGWQSVGCNRYAVTLKDEAVCGLDFVNEPAAAPCPPWPEDSCRGYRPGILPSKDQNTFCPPY